VLSSALAVGLFAGLIDCTVNIAGKNADIDASSPAVDAAPDVLAIDAASDAASADAGPNDAATCPASVVALTKTGAALGDTGSFAAASLGGQASIEWWVQFNQASADDNAEMAVSTAYDDSTGWYCLATSNQIGFSLQYSSASLTLYAMSLSIGTGAWHHIACDYDGTTMREFLDGALVASKTATGSLDTDGQHLLILWRDLANYASDTGLYALREIRIGNASAHVSPFTPEWTLAPTIGTIALYHASEGAGTTLSSVDAGAPSITLTGSTSWASYATPPCK
jgi:hypothetical protein